MAESCDAVTNTTGGAPGICQDLLQRLQAVEAGHVLVERDHVDAALRQPVESLLAAGRMHDLKARAASGRARPAGPAPASSSI